MRGLLGLKHLKELTRMNRDDMSIPNSSSLPTDQEIRLEWLYDKLSRYLSIISRWIQILLNEEVGPLNEKQRDYLMHVHNVGEKAKETLDAFLTAKAEIIEALDLAKCVDEAVERIHTQVETKKQTLTIQLSNVPQVLFNKERLVQVLVELLFNAHKFTPPQGKIILTAKEFDRFVKVSIADTGIGIDSESQKWLLGGFYHTRLQEGIIECGGGFGFAISKAIIESFGGELGFESELGKGSIFWFTIKSA